MSEATPKQLGRYQIVGELGRGAMGIVYEAKDPALDRTVALKTVILQGDAAERTTFEARFLQEAKAAGKLSHPAIITMYDVGKEGDLVYIAMERLQGVDLKKQMEKAPPPPRAALNIAAQVADALAYAHEHGIVHRDIKPANIMLLKGGRTKIMDFGIARMQHSDVKTQTGVLVGTPKYMSPEQVAGGQVDQRADIFSLGAVLYEMLTGRAPFGGSDVSQLMHSIAHAPHVAPTRVARGLPAVIDLIVDRALAKDAGQRYPTAAALADDLRSALTELPAAPAPRAAAAPAADATSTAVMATPAPAIESTLVRTGPGVSAFCPLSRRFDSSQALQRLVKPSPKDREMLAAVPRRVSAVAHVLRDPDLRLLAIAVAVSLLASLAIAFR